MKGNLYLIPTYLTEEPHQEIIPSQALEVIKVTRYYLCENIRSARRYVSSLKIHESIEALHFEILDKNTKPESLSLLMKPLQDGNNMGIISESGCPGIADPGSLAVQYAHRNNIRVAPLTGPSSILLGLMASGLNGQQFAFHGYLPIDEVEAIQAIKKLERESKEKNQTQIFIETPYRNNALLGRLIKTLHPHTQLCAAIQLTGPGEKIFSRLVMEWKNHPETLAKEPAVFLFLASA